MEVAKREDFRGAAKCQSFGHDCRQASEKLEEFWQEMPESWQESCPTLDDREVKTILQRAEGILWTP